MFKVSVLFAAVFLAPLIQAAPTAADLKKQGFVVVQTFLDTPANNNKNREGDLDDDESTTSDDEDEWRRQGFLKVKTYPDERDQSSRDFVDDESSGSTDSKSVNTTRWELSTPDSNDIISTSTRISYEKKSNTEWVELHNGRVFDELREVLFTRDDKNLPLVILQVPGAYWIKLTEGKAFASLDGKEFTLPWGDGKWTAFPKIEEDDNDDDDSADDEEDDQNDRNLIDDKDANAGKVCERTCRSQDLTWFGTWGSMNGRDVAVCQCENRPDQKSESSRAATVSMKECERKFCETLLTEHNWYRDHHFKRKALVTEARLQARASAHAKKLAQTGVLEDSQGGYGENVGVRFEGQKPALTSKYCSGLGQTITKMWYDEQDDWDFVKSQPKRADRVTKHFTQLIWSDSAKIGCGLGVDSSGRNFYAVAQYTPPGNVAGKYSLNVKPFGPRI